MLLLAAHLHDLHARGLPLAPQTVEPLDVSPEVPLAGEAGVAEPASVDRALVLLGMRLECGLTIKHKLAVVTPQLVEGFDFIRSYFFQW